MRRVTDRLPPPVADRLRRRLEALAPLGSLAVEEADLGPAGERALAELAGRLGGTYPYSEPEYAGQMLKPPHPVAWAAYAATMLLNPNNHSLDGGPATSELEREAVAQIAAMVGLADPLAHLTSSGTVANLEALWIARELHPDRAIVSCENAHYTHPRLCALLGVGHETLPQDERGRLDLAALGARLAAGGVGTVVATAGTTSLGALDDVAAVADLCAAHKARLHVDAAYGGFFALVDPEPFRALARADSVVVDPHKHGLQPYGCGCVLFADAGVAGFFHHDSPYTYFSTSEHHPGETTLECSRPGAAAAALWATLRALPLTRTGSARISQGRGRRASRSPMRCVMTSSSWSSPSSTSSASSPAIRRRRRSRRRATGRSRRSPRRVGTWPSSASTPSGCAGRARGSRRMRRRRRCCGSA